MTFRVLPAVKNSASFMIKAIKRRFHMKKVSTLLIIALIFSFSLPVFAHGDSAEHIQVMRQAATELQATNPDLSKKLKDLAEKKEKNQGKWAEEGEKMIA